jgi:hypothetical protein
MPDTPASALPAPRMGRAVVRAKRDQRMRRIIRRARTLAPHLDSAVFSPILQSFARVSLLLGDCYEKLRDGELLDEDGELRPSINTVRALAETQMRLARELGLTPVTLRQLGREKRVDLAAALAGHVEDAEEVAAGGDDETI